MQSHQQTSSTPTGLFKTLHEQVQLMNLRSNEARGFLHRRMPWHRYQVLRNNRIIDALVEPYIQARLNSAEDKAANKRKNTVVDLAVRYLDHEHNATAGQSQVNASTTEVIVANIKAFLFAGQDTTAATICFLMKCLEDNPDCLSKMQSEHSAVLGPNPDDAAKVLQETPQHLYNLPYTLGVIKETLRLYPLASSARAAPTFAMPLTVPASTTQYPLEGFSPWPAAPAIQQNPEYWPEPTKFMPERWTAAEGERLFPRKDAWMPFSLGALS